MQLFVQGTHFPVKRLVWERVGHEEQMQGRRMKHDDEKERESKFEEDLERRRRDND